MPLDQPINIFFRYLSLFLFLFPLSFPVIVKFSHFYWFFFFFKSLDLHQFLLLALHNLMSKFFFFFYVHGDRTFAGCLWHGTGESDQIYMPCHCSIVRDGANDQSNLLSRTKKPRSLVFVYPQMSASLETIATEVNII